MLDFIAIGDSTLDVFLQISEASLSCQINKEQCLLCLQYAEKIPVESVVQIPGAGNASNAAVGASRLGLHAAIVSILGKDEIGKEIVEGWKREKVDTRYVTWDPKRGTNYSTVLNYKGERTILVHGERRQYRLPKLDGAKWIYYTSLGPGHEPLERQMLAHLKKHPAQKLCFNPGTKQLRRGLRSIKPVIARSDVFIVNKQEAELLLGDGERPIQALLVSLKHLCPGIVVITDGPKGSHATDGQTIWSLGIFAGPVVERTGAGDSYATGFVCALFMGLSIPEAMRVGTAQGWSVVQYIGPQKGLLTRAKAKAALKKFSKVKVASMPVMAT
ncbi:carbohydrate kinase family protein [Patescibacteria group bacterium]|jgi:sugar/nucleoside kinase (ribokinase family)|nr:carbohydrate kinase family protein [Patescibacteria group bacterium]